MLFEFLPFFLRRKVAFEAKERVLDLEHEFLALVLFAFADAPDFKGKLTDH